MALPESVVIKKAVKLRSNLNVCGVVVGLIGIGQIASQGLSLISICLLAIAAGLFKAASMIKTHKRKVAESGVYK